MLRQQAAPVASPSSPFAHPPREPASLHSLLSLYTTEAPRAHLARHTHTHPGCERGSSPYASAAYPRIQQKWEETLMNKLEGSQTPTTFPASFSSLFLCVPRSPPLFPGAGWLKSWNNPDTVLLVIKSEEKNSQSLLTTDAQTVYVRESPAWMELPKVCS